MGFVFVLARSGDGAAGVLVDAVGLRLLLKVVA